MKSVEVSRIGGPEVLRVADTPLPPATKGAARVRLAYAGVNFSDQYDRTDFFRHEGDPPRETPFVLGSEGVGLVDAIGDDAQGVRTGDRVGFVAHRAKAYAEYTVIPVDRLIPIPKDIDDATAVTFLVSGMTAYCLLTGFKPVTPGMTVLVTGATGSIGSCLTQWAAGLGARVICVVSSATKVPLAKANGATAVVNLETDDVAAKVREITKGTGVSLALEGVGGELFAKIFETLGVRGHILRYGMAGGKPKPLDLTTIGGRSRSVSGLTLFDFISAPKDLAHVSGAVFDAIRKGWLRNEKPHVFPLDQAVEAHRQLADKARSGKIILRMAN